ncbi:unnamed protein product [Ectocarpus sp. 12 AP-2014]
MDWSPLLSLAARSPLLRLFCIASRASLLRVSQPAICASSRRHAVVHRSSGVLSSFENENSAVEAQPITESARLSASSFRSAVCCGEQALLVVSAARTFAWETADRTPSKSSSRSPINASS